MKTWLKLLIAVAILGIIAAFFVLRYINKPQTDIEKATPAFSLTIDDLWKHKDDLTKMKYLDVLEITGKLSKVEDRDTVVNAIFIMGADPDFGDQTIRCVMLPKYKDATLLLKTGETVKVKGRCDGYNGTDINLIKCSLVK